MLAEGIWLIELVPSNPDEHSKPHHAKGNDKESSCLNSQIHILLLNQCKKGLCQLPRLLKQHAYKLLVTASVLVQCLILREAYKDYVDGQDFAEALFRRLPLLVLYSYAVIGVLAIKTHSFNVLVAALSETGIPASSAKRIHIFKQSIRNKLTVHTVSSNYTWTFLHRSSRFELALLVLRGVVLFLVVVTFIQVSDEAYVYILDRARRFYMLETCLTTFGKCPQ
jgi:hypothetical protein